MKRCAGTTISRTTGAEAPPLDEGSEVLAVQPYAPAIERGVLRDDSPLVPVDVGEHCHRAPRDPGVLARR